MRYSVEGLPYNYALGLINDLKRAQVEANITAGGISIWATESQLETAKSVCQQHARTMFAGQTTHQKTILGMSRCH